MATTLQYQLTKKGGPFNLVKVPKAAPDSKQVAIRMKAVALNPLDWKQLDTGLMITKWPTVLGYDGSGIVEAVGADVTKFKAGDEVFANFRSDHSEVKEQAAFQEVAIIPEQHISLKPKKLSFEEAASLPVGYVTAANAVFCVLKVPLPFVAEMKHMKCPHEYKSILVLGGSSSVGASVIQLLRLSLPAVTIITTSSPAHNDRLKELGATTVLSYKDLSLISDIKGATPDGRGVDAIIDTVASAASQTDIFESFSQEGPKIYGEVATEFSGQISPPEGVTRNIIMAADIFGTPGGGEVLYALGQLIEDGKFVVPVKVEVVGYGFDAIGLGVEKLRAGVSGTKLVVSL
ncbi:GroES-like protein [Microthyrium microscopicum]|uniref:GroES-like protein n=1 Tax=Microthyrium microscopicum TaxID=703497 RepID=A0A6A6UGC2_9PEZI|nr:GroES-like protein [Microthyrium microscopicum]